MHTSLSVFPPFRWFALRRGPAHVLTRAPLIHRLALQGPQPRMIDTRGVWLLRVLQGRVWLTQPGAWQDLFLDAGAGVELRQPGVLVQAEPVTPGARHEAQALCELRRLGP